MGLTNKSVGIKAVDMGLCINKSSDNDKVIALAGNPNVGKSTVFNALTGMHQHTGNWPGKTVTNTQGVYKKNEKNYIMVDIPGMYSLFAHSAEEEVARDFICFGNSDGVIVVCDATCLERNLNLVLQTAEIAKNVIVCVNLIDEAKKKSISIDIVKLSKELGIKVVATSARGGKGLKKLMDETEKMLINQSGGYAKKIDYGEKIEAAILRVETALKKQLHSEKINLRWVAIRLLEGDEKLILKISEYLEYNLLGDDEINDAVDYALKELSLNGICRETLCDEIASKIVKRAEKICEESVLYQDEKYSVKDRRLDLILTNKITGIPIMICLLGVVFWLTIAGANIPSEIIYDFLFNIEGALVSFCKNIGVSKVIYEPLIFGVYRVVAWVVSVMLPPMAIFFPFFTFLEDLGYLPRVAFNLDKTFRKCCACGKQALSMCMGFGCNAAGVVGCRIIDSPRERLIAILTNNFVPCNGRFPTLISIISMFFVFSDSSWIRAIFSSVILMAVVMIGVFVTFAVSWGLSKTILKGQPSSFTLELPPYRMPRIGRIVVRSIFDRTIFVLGRAVCAAAPTGLLIWIFANVKIYDTTILNYASGFLNPFAEMIGLDGVILLSFILGLPANEIVVPIMIMAYMSNSTISSLSNFQLRELLLSNGWTWVTAINVMLFSLLHWPCSTTMMTIKKETGSVKWTIVAFLIPTIIAIASCFLVNMVSKIF